MTTLPWVRTVRWVRPDAPAEVADRLEHWPCPAGGAVRHLYPLAVLEEQGAAAVWTARQGGRWAACVVLPGRVVVPCGDATVIAAAGSPVRRWRLVVGDAAAVDALVGTPPPGVRVHTQRLMRVDPARVPPAEVLPDPGLRLAELGDVAALAELAVQLHVDDRFGPDPGPSGYHGYRDRLAGAVRQGRVWCVGPRGAPVLKIERSAWSARYGVQLSGICVRRGERGRGLGRAAVAAAIRQALSLGRPITLHVRADNAPALRAYRAAGFVDVEEWRLAVRV